MSTRRDFFRQAATFAGGAKTLGTLLASLQRASAIDPPAGSSFLDAEHVVILMQENRSFDHAFGTLHGVRGFNDPRAVTLPDQKPVWLQSNAAGETYAPFRLDLKDTKATWLGSLPHSWRDQTDARNHGNHDGWLEAKASDREDCAGMPLTMGYYDREDLPFYYALADVFTICDQHFCSSLTATTPNRLHLWTGTIREKPDAAFTPNVRNSDVDYGASANWKTFPERLEEAGISWRIYQNELSAPSGLEGEHDAWLANFGDNPLEWFEQYHIAFRKTHAEHMERMAAALPSEIQKLRAQGGQEKKIAAAERFLQYVKSERAQCTPEARTRLSARDWSLHEKAFTTNEEDPAYRQLSTLKYRDGAADREMAIPKSDPLYRFRRDVDSGKLPCVSWLVAPERFSDHPSSPWYGAWYVAETLNILTKNPAVWSKTIFILTYDENDGYFDHVPPFVAPEPGNPESGKTSAGIDASLEYLPLEQDLKRNPAHDARGGPVGLGYRVPLVIASPWSRGGYVCSQVFDHTSVLQLLERVLSHRSGTQIRETNITAWRRTVCGDLTSAFRPFQGGEAAVAFPSRDSFFEQVHKAQFTRMPAGYRKLNADDVAQIGEGRSQIAWMPQQEPGVRPSAALPYELAVSGEISADGKRFEMVLLAGNAVFGKAAAGAPFHVYTPGKFRGQVKLRTRAYAVAAGERLTDSWELDGFEKQAYHLRVCGPNGFLREFGGDKEDPRVEIQFEYARAKNGLTGGVELRFISRAARALTLEVKDHGYKNGDHTMVVEPGGERRLVMALAQSHHWYDFSLTIVGADRFLRRFAGRVETGESGFSDPVMGRLRCSESGRAVILR
ncbi:MAG TPA: phospholipase C, phosphocholine-specific [Bryobacteraceae bacterium]|nr:phospholipase C, phosphocholine-specific [Bryobacteraceae bacterium]